MSPVCTPAAKRSRQEKAAQTASSEVGPLAWRGLWCIWNRCPRAFGVRDTAVILPAALRAPSRYFIKPQAASSVSSRSSNRRQLLRSTVVLRTAGSFVVSSRSATVSAACAERVGARGRTVSADPQPAPRNQRHVRNSRLVSAPRRGEADGPHRAQAKSLVWRRTLPASTQCEAGRMTALSRTPNGRGHRFQMHHCPLQARGPASKLAV